jgi:hypothetical protein
LRHILCPIHFFFVGWAAFEKFDALQNLLSSHLLPKNVNIKTYKSIILPVVLHGCETWHFTLKEEYRLRVFGNRVLQRIFGPKRDEVTGGWINCMMKSFIVYNVHQIFGLLKVKKKK